MSDQYYYQESALRSTICRNPPELSVYSVDERRSDGNLRSDQSDHPVNITDDASTTASSEILIDDPANDADEETSEVSDDAAVDNVDDLSTTPSPRTPNEIAIDGLDENGNYADTEFTYGLPSPPAQGGNEGNTPEGQAASESSSTHSSDYSTLRLGSGDEHYILTNPERLEDEPEDNKIWISQSILVRSFEISHWDKITHDEELLNSMLEDARKLSLPSVSVHPYYVSKACEYLANSQVKVCSVIGAPHGSSTIDNKMCQTEMSLRDGAREIELVPNLGRIQAEDCEYIISEIHQINNIAKGKGAILKLVLERNEMEEAMMLRLCHICVARSVAFISYYDCSEAERPGKDIPLIMGVLDGSNVQLKAMTPNSLDQTLSALNLGATRIGTLRGKRWLWEARHRGISDEMVQAVAGQGTMQGNDWGRILGRLSP